MVQECREAGGMHVNGWRGCVRRLAWLELVYCKWGHAVEAVYDMDRLEVLILDGCEGPWKNLSKLCHGCGGLEEFSVVNRPFDDNISNSLRSLSKLKKLKLVGVTNLNILAAVSPNLQLLQVERCSDLQQICSLGPLHDLITLSVSSCRLLKAITGLEGATQLQNISISNCDTLEEIPGLHYLINLKHLSLNYCPRLKLLREWNINALRGLISLNLSWSCPSVGEIGLHNLINLKELSIQYCPLLKSITQCSGAPQLQNFVVSLCDALEEIQGLHDLVNLKHLSIEHCPLLKSIAGPHDGELQMLKVSKCASLEGLHGFFNVEKLSISECPLLKSVSDQVMSVRELSIEDCPLLTVIPRLNGVAELNIRSLESLKEIQGLHDLMNLITLTIEKCPLLKAIAIPPAVHLRLIQIWECASLEEIPPLSGLISLLSIDIFMCPRLKAILLDSTGAGQLEQIRFSFCESLEEIPALHGLRYLSLSHCPCLKVIPDLSSAVQLEHVDISEQALGVYSNNYPHGSHLATRT